MVTHALGPSWSVERKTCGEGEAMQGAARRNRTTNGPGPTDWARLRGRAMRLGQCPSAGGRAHHCARPWCSDGRFCTVAMENANGYTASVSYRASLTPSVPNYSKVQENRKSKLLKDDDRSRTPPASPQPTAIARSRQYKCLRERDRFDTTL